MFFLTNHRNSKTSVGDFQHLEMRDLGGGFKRFFMFTPNPGEMIQFDEHIFQLGWN